MSNEPDPLNKRIRPRQSLRLRVDGRMLTEEERLGILSGQGFPELDVESPALTRPRNGLARLESRDVSASGLRVRVDGLQKVEAGAAMSMDLHLPGDHRVIRLLGDVIWRADQDGESVAGLRIAALEVEGLQRLLLNLDRPLSI